jgi:hypothetical protein
MSLNNDHAARLREVARVRLPEHAVPLLAGAEALERAVWRPISEAHEDFGPVVLIDMADPGSVELAHVCDLHWWKKAEGMTHFAQLPLLTEAIATAALARVG